MQELKALREHTNMAFESISDAYNCVGNRINHDWTLESVPRNKSARLNSVKDESSEDSDDEEISDDGDVEFIRTVPAPETVL